MNYRRIKLNDGTSWPHPGNDSDDPDEGGIFEREMAAAYAALLTHPWGSNVSCEKVRELRRKIKKRGLRKQEMLADRSRKRKKPLL